MSDSSTTASTATDSAAVIAVGALAATLATVSHETLGHGLACVGIGGHVTLLTSIWFRCSRWSGIVDTGGPIGNLVMGCAAVALLGYARPSAKLRLLLLMFGALNLFCFMGQLAFESLTGTRDDWYSTALDMGWPAVWRPVAAIVGIGGYLLVGRLLVAVIGRQGGPQAHAIRLAYAAAAASAVMAGLMWRPEPFRSAIQGFLTFGIAPLGLLRLARRATREAGHDVGDRSVAGAWICIAVCVVVFGVFLFVQARGLGSMAGSRLPP